MLQLLYLPCGLEKFCDRFECNVRSECGATATGFSVRIRMGCEWYCIKKCRVEECATPAVFNVWSGIVCDNICIYIENCNGVTATVFTVWSGLRCGDIYCIYCEVRNGVRQLLFDSVD